MGYAAGEALLLAAVRAHSNYSSSNTARANWSILNSGKSAHYVILRAGVGTFTDDSLGAGIGGGTARARNWQTQLMVYQRYVDDGTTATDLQARVDELIGHLEAYPRLGDTTGAVRDAQVAGVSELQQINEIGGGVIWLMWIIYINWIEQV